MASVVEEVGIVALAHIEVCDFFGCRLEHFALAVDVTICVNADVHILIDFAYEIIEECYDLPEFAKNYFDYEKFARDLFMCDYWFDDGFVFRAA